MSRSDDFTFPSHPSYFSVYFLVVFFGADRAFLQTWHHCMYVNTVLCRSFGISDSGTCIPKGQAHPSPMLWQSFFTKSSQAIWSAFLHSLQERDVGFGLGKVPV